MTKYRVADLEGALLDAAVAMAEGGRLPDYWRDPDNGTCWARPGREEWQPSSRWDQGGPIIDRERIKLEPWPYDDTWQANGVWGPTPLVAAMRAFVTSKLGDEVDL